MNFFDLHIGDYEAATAHLSMLEDAAYCRMLRIYYRTEKPLPADVKQVQRLVRATTKAERDAVQQVLSDFFELRDDGWHQHRCDAEIAAYVAGEPEREAKKANEETRLKRHREERAALFMRLTEAGQHAPWNIGTKELRSLVAGLQKAGPETNPATPPETPATLPATAPATPATATQYPLPTTQVPEEEKKTPPASPGPPAVAVEKPAPPLKASDMIAEGVDCQKAADWLALRKAKRLPLTPTAWAETKAEGAKAGLSAPATVAYTVAHNWAGFRFSWWQRDNAPRGSNATADATFDGVH